MSGTSSVSPTILVPGAPVAANSSIDATGLILSTTAHGQAFGNNPLSQGSFYFEAKFDSVAQYSAIGVGSPAQVAQGGDNIIYTQAYGAAMLRQDGLFISNGGQFAPQVSPGVGDVVGIAVALPNLVWMRLNGGPWNGNASADPASGVGGFSLASVPAPICPILACTSGIEVIANFGQHAFAFAPPALFGEWPGAEQIVLNAPPQQEYNIPITLTGATSNGVAAVLDYSTDNGVSWTPVANYTAEAEWTGTGPAYPGDAFGMIAVRDHATPSVVSAYVPFTVQEATHYTEIGNAAWGDLHTEVGNDAGYEPNWNATQQGLNCGFHNVNIQGDGFHASNANVLANGWSNHVLAKFDYVLNPDYAVYIDPNSGTVSLEPFKFVLATTDSFLSFGCGLIVNTNQDAAGDAINTPGKGIFITLTGEQDISTPMSGHVEIHWDYDPPSQTMIVMLIINGEQVGTSTIQTPAAKFSETELPACAVYTYNSHAITQMDDNAVVISGFGFYDSTPPVEGITITQANGYGGLVQLVGSNTGTIATAMDYVLDGGGWAPVSNFAEGADWSGQGPQVTLGTHTIQVRDHTDTSTVSNVETFSVGVGIFVWDGVLIH